MILKVTTSPLTYPAKFRFATSNRTNRYNPDQTRRANLMILPLFRRDRRSATIAALYGAIVAQARSALA